MKRQHLSDHQTLPLFESLEPRLLLTTWGPLIQFDTWSQGGIYDDYVPLDPTGERSDVGCVATAASQVLYYWNYPTAIPFSSNATWFDWNGDKYTSKGDNGNIRIDEDAASNDFPNLPTLNSELSAIDYDFDADEMGYLSFGVGVKYEMDYSSDGSGAYTSAGGWIFEDDFRFGSAEVGRWPRDRNEVIDNIKSGWPIIVGISDPDAGGHSVVIDGYRDTDDRFHVNLGWGGSGDDWYSLPNINAGGYTFNTVHTVVYNIAPYQGWTQVGADAQNTYASPYTIPSAEPDLKWECTVPQGMSRYKFKDIVVGSEGKIYASLSPMDLGQGNHPYIAVLDPHGVIDKSIVIPDSDYGINHLSQNSRGEVFFGTSEYATKSSVYRVNPKTDTVTRLFDHASPDRGIFDQPIKVDADDYLYFLVTPQFSSNGAKFYSLTRSGSERWTVSFPSQMKFYRSSAAIDEARNQVYLNYYDSSAQKSYLRCFNRSNGSVEWTYAFPGTHTASEMAGPASIGPDGTVYVGSFTSVYALSPTNGAKQWSTDFYPSYVMGEGLRAVGADGTVYVGHGKMVGGNWRPAYVSALNPANGSIKWQREVATGLSSFDNMGEVYVGKNGVVAAAYTKNDVHRLAGIMDSGSSGQVAWDVAYGGKMAFGPGQTIYVVPAEAEASIYALSVGDRGDPDGLGMAYTNNQRPNSPSNLGPVDGSQDLDTTVTLSWACSDPDGHGLFYDVYLGGGGGQQQGEMVPIAADFAGTSLMLSDLSPGQSYVWRVVATDGQTITPGPGWSFSTAPAIANWTGSVDDHWENSSNWSGDVVPGPSHTAIFDAPATHNPCLYQDESVEGLDSRIAGWTMGGSGHTLAVGPGGVDSAGAGTNTVEPDVAMADDAAWTVGDGNTLVLDGTLSGGGHALTKDGDGTLVLEGGQDHSTGLSLTVNGGTVRQGGGTLVLNGLFFGTDGGAADASASTMDHAPAASGGSDEDAIASGDGDGALADAVFSPEVALLMEASEAESVLGERTVDARDAGPAVPSSTLAAAVSGMPAPSSPPQVSQTYAAQHPFADPVVTETAPVPATPQVSGSELADGLLESVEPIDLLVPLGA